MEKEVLATWESEADGVSTYTLTAEQTDTPLTLIVILPEKPKSQQYVKVLFASNR